MSREIKDELIARVFASLPEKEDMLREAKSKFKNRIFFPSFHMGAYFTKLRVMKVLEDFLKEDLEHLKKQIDGHS